MARTFLAIDSSYEQLTQIASSYREQHVYPYLQTKGYQRRLLTAPPCYFLSEGICRNHPSPPSASLPTEPTPPNPPDRKPPKARPALPKTRASTPSTPPTSPSSRSEEHT